MDISKAKAALAALAAAGEACKAAGVSVDCDALRGSQGSAIDAIVRVGEARIASEERRALPIAFGDEVRVGADNVALKPRRVPTLANIGRSLVCLKIGEKECRFRLDDGRENDGYGHRYIDADDLVRINRDLTGKRAPKAAPIAAEIATIKKGTP